MSGKNAIIREPSAQFANRPGLDDLRAIAVRAIATW